MRALKTPYTVRRLLQVVPTVLAIVLAGFVLIHVAPGDPVLALAGEHGDQAYYDFMRGRFGLDRPLPERTLTYFRRVLSGDFGVSYVQGRPVSEVILARVPSTLLLTGSALLLSTIAGILLGALAATKPHGKRDTAASALALTLFAAPVFWLGQIAVVVAAFQLGWFPVYGMRDPGAVAGGWTGTLDVLHHLALPALVLASQELAAVSRLTRAGLVTELDSGYVRTARAKGLPERVVLFRHALRRALLPVVTVVGSRVGHLLAGAVLIEVVFAWPGIGRLLVAAIQARDTPVLMGIFFLVAFTIVLANLLTDLTYRFLDPRIRYD